MADSRRVTEHLKLFAADGTAVGTLVREERRRSGTYGRRFVIQFREAAELIKGVRNPTALRLYLQLPWMLSTSAFRRLDQRVLAEEYRVGQPAISKALTELMRIGVIEREGKGPGVRYRLSPLVSWSGTAEQYHAQQHREGRNYRAEAGARVLTAQLTLHLGPTTKDDT